MADVDDNEEVEPGPTPQGKRQYWGRGRTECPADTKRAVIVAQAALAPEDMEYERPKTRADCMPCPSCAGGHGSCGHDPGRAHMHVRPCVYTGCSRHLYLEVNPETGTIKFNWPNLEVWELEETCSLDVADRDGATLEAVGDFLNLTRERVRQIEVKGIARINENTGWDDLETVPVKTSQEDP